MKVKELIELLQCQNGEREVVAMYDNECVEFNSFANILKVQSVVDSARVPVEIVIDL